MASIGFAYQGLAQMRGDRRNSFYVVEQALSVPAPADLFLVESCPAAGTNDWFGVNITLTIWHRRFVIRPVL